MPPNTTPTGTSVSRRSAIQAARRASRSAANTRTASLASSEGCSENGP